MPTAMHHFTDTRLRRVVRTLLERAGSEPAEAAQVADHLVDANLRGHDTHRVRMIPHYVHNITGKTMRPNTGPSVVRDGGAVMGFDGGMGFGQRGGAEMMERLIPRARELGAVVASLRNVHHLGRIGAVRPASESGRGLRRFRVRRAASADKVSRTWHNGCTTEPGPAFEGGRYAFGRKNGRTAAGSDPVEPETRRQLMSCGRQGAEVTRSPGAGLHLRPIRPARLLHCVSRTPKRAAHRLHKLLEAKARPPQCSSMIDRSSRLASLSARRSARSSRARARRVVPLTHTPVSVASDQGSGPASVVYR